jgi:hypothetical protein
MSGVPLEICWTFNKLWNNKFYYKAASCWYFYWVILRCTDPWISNTKFCSENLKEFKCLERSRVGGLGSVDGLFWTRERMLEFHRDQWMSKASPEGLYCMEIHCRHIDDDVWSPITERCARRRLVLLLEDPGTMWFFFHFFVPFLSLLTLILDTAFRFALKWELLVWALSI